MSCHIVMLPSTAIEKWDTIPPNIDALHYNKPTRNRGSDISHSLPNKKPDPEPQQYDLTFVLPIKLAILTQCVS